MIGKLTVFLASLSVAVSAAVQTLTIDSSNAYAYSAENRLACDSGSKITVTHSYRADGRTMKEALIDFIDVTPAADGAAEPYVVIIVSGEGLKNDVDFSDQPYLWLAAPVKGPEYASNEYQILQGIYEPYGNVYRMGYNGVQWKGESGLLVTNLVDNPVTGEPRSVLLRGKGATSLRTVSGGTYTLTGELTVEDEANLCSGNTTGLALFKRVTFRNNAGFVVKSSTASLAATTEIVLDGTVRFHVSGGSGYPLLTLNGDVSGNGTLTLTDQGGIAFNGTNNTFTGAVKIANTGTMSSQDVRIGNGSRFSWGGAALEGFSVVRHRLVLNTASNVVFTPVLPSQGHVVKEGAGAVTLAQPFNRTTAVGSNLPAFEINGGKLVCGVEPPTSMTGTISLGSGTVFDLGGFPCASCYLPFGGGAISNAAAGTPLVLQGSGTNDLTFVGQIAADVRVANMGTNVWKLTRATRLEGSLAVDRGRVSIGSFFVMTNAVSVAKGGRLIFETDEYRRRQAMTGLALDIWTGLASAASHTAYLEKCLALVDQTEPNVRTDMAKFTQGIHSGEPPSSSDASSPFGQVLGGSENYFCALFSGYFFAEKAGTYSFQMQADDSCAVWLDNRMIGSAKYGNTQIGTCSTTLSAGWHSFRTLFCEETGAEIFILKVKGPGESDYHEFKLETLVAVHGPGLRLPSLSGDGEIALAEGGLWPQIDDTTNFSGDVVVDANTVGDIGLLPLHSATLKWGADRTADGGFWSLAKRSELIVTNGATAVALTPGEANTKGALNSSGPIVLGRPWSMSFDYQAIKPQSSNLGDGFFIGVHSAGGTAYDGDQWGYGDSLQRINQATAYGLQVYMYAANYTQLVWVNNNNIYADAGAIVTNRTFTLTNAKENPMHVTMSYDGSEKLIVSFARGDNVFAVTNSLAGRDFAAKYTTGSAYLGLWGSNGNCYTRTLVENLKYEDGTDLECPLGGSLQLLGGSINMKSAVRKSVAIASSLDVLGEVVLTPSSGLEVRLEGTTWSFDLDNMATVLVPQTGVVFPSAVTLNLTTTGEWPKQKRLLADFSSTEGALPNFALGADVPAKVKLILEGRKLYASAASGTLVVFR